MPTGAPCATETDCPPELVCDRGHCERELSEIDASVLSDAPITIVEHVAGSVLAADGGGGGGGGIFTASGAAGQDGGANAVPASGGVPASGSTRGGSGGAATTTAASSADVPSDRNTGGGGGAVGRIYIRSVSTSGGGIVSPPAGSGPLRSH